ncbi:MAG: hypothetical protein U0973_03580 [Xanthomonadaceae bacterium]|nr:hypothetical protein [Xanthomonadaceae bacterium]
MLALQRQADRFDLVGIGWLVEQGAVGAAAFGFRTVLDKAPGKAPEEKHRTPTNLKFPTPQCAKR